MRTPQKAAVAIGSGTALTRGFTHSQHQRPPAPHRSTPAWQRFPTAAGR